MTTPTRQQVEAALAKVSPHPLNFWRTNPDGTITAINTIGQKFILRLEAINLNTLLDTILDQPTADPPPTPPNPPPQQNKRSADPPPTPPKPKKK